MWPSPGYRREPSAPSDRIAAVGQGLCLGGAGLGLVGLVGWLSGATWLTTLAPDQPPMMPNTAVGLSLLGIAGALRRRELAGARRTLSLAAAGLVFALGLATLAEYVFAVDLRIDQAFVVSHLGPHPGRPSPPTALAFALLGAAVLLYDVRPAARVRPAEWLIASAGLIAFTALLGQLFGAGPLYRLEHAPVIGVAVPTAVSLLLTTFGLLLERPDRGVMLSAASAGPGGVLLRRLAVAAVFGPIVLGMILSRLLAVLGIEEFALVYASLTVVTTAVALLVLVVTAIRLDRMHAALESTRARTQALFDQAVDGIFVADLTGRYIDVNESGCRMLGYPREELLGKHIVDLLPPEAIERLASHKQRIFAGDTEISEWLLRRSDGAYLPVEINAKLLPDGRWQAIVRDISERKRVQEALQQSMERFDLALRGADLAAWDWNVTTGEVVFSPRWAQMRGFRPEELRPHVDSWRTGIHPDDLPRVEKTLMAHFEGLTPEYEAEHRVATKSGDWIWILDRGRVFARDAEGRPTRMVGTELDITARKRAEEAIRLSESKFSGIVAISADAIVSIDDDQRITLFNEGAEAIFGYSRAEALGQPLDILIPERFRAAYRRLLERFAASAQVARRMGGRTLLGLRKNGEEFPAEASISRLDVGSTRLLTVAVRDVTEQQRRESEKELLAEIGGVLASSLDDRRMLSSVAEVAVRSFADACIVDVVDDGGEVRRVTVACRDPSLTRACEALARLPADRRRTGPTATAMATRRPLLVADLSPETASALPRDEPQLRALRALDPRSLLAVPLIVHDKLLGALAFVSSSRPYAPRDLRLAEELAQRVALSLENVTLYRATRRAVQARDEVLGVVAHDLRNPLGVVIGQAKLLLQRLAPGNAARRSAESIERAGRRMSRLIDDLLDITRMEAGRLSVEPTRLSPARLVADAAEAQRGLASAAAIALRVDVAPDLPDVSADRDRLLQVFENLIGNALKFTGSGGEITLGARLRGREVLFHVADTGVGIPAEQLPHLFDRFWQAQQARRLGAGLGLSIVKGIVEAHGGRVWVESAPGRGSTFSFTIPTAGSAERPQPGPIPRSA